MPYVPVSSIIDCSIPVPSIFNREKPLADNILIRIARGIQKYVIEDESFIIDDTAYFLSHYYTHQGKETRCSSLREPILPKVLVQANLSELCGDRLEEVI